MIAAALALALAAAQPPAPLPPYTGAYQPQGVDERGIWMLADEEERRLADSRFVLRDAALDAYLRRVLCDTVGPDRCAGVRLYVVRIPFFNASMMANGTLQVWTGLLLRLRSEAELAAVLAHEFAHFEQRHLLASYRHTRTMADIAMWASVIGTTGVIIAQAAADADYAFSRSEERDADARAFAYLAASPYRPLAQAEVWDRMMDEADATAAGRHLPSQRYARTAFFATHPTTLERANTLHKLAADAPGGADEAEAYQAALAPWRARFLDDQLKLNDFAGTEYLLAALARDGWTAELLTARAELYRLRNNPRDLVASAEFYRQAIAKGADDPLVHRNFGMVLLRRRANAEGVAQLQLYLSLRPEADDAAMVRSLIEQAATP